jgi:hypothetical protein
VKAGGIIPAAVGAVGAGRRSTSADSNSSGGAVSGTDSENEANAAAGVTMKSLSQVKWEP